MSALSPQAEILYKAMHDQHNFLKKQQWVITNYGLLIYAAIFGLQKQTHITGPCAKLLLALLVGLVCIVGIILLVIVQLDIGNSRSRIEDTEANIFDAAEKVQLLITRSNYPRWRGISFLVPLIGALIVGALLAILGVYS